MYPHRLPAPAPGAADTVDVVDVMRTVRNQWRAVAAFLALGVVGAVAVIVFAPRRFDGTATVLARPGAAAGGSISGRMSGISDLLGGLGGIGGLSSTIETELQLLRSRALAAEVVDSLKLQVRVREPEGFPASVAIAEHDFPGRFPPRSFELSRQRDGSYRAAGDAQTFTLVPGTPSPLGPGRVTLATGNLPARMELTILDREDAITRFGKRLRATKAGGDIAKIVVRGDDSLSAAQGANVLVNAYLERRKTTDRGVNQRRVEYVSAQLDSTARELAATERELRRYQESTGVLDAEVSGEVEAEQIAELRRALTDIQVDEASLKQMLAQSAEGRITSRDLAAYPAFLRGSAVSPLVGQLSSMEVQRHALLERRTEKDPEVIALDQGIRSIEADILSLVRTYAASVTRQREQMQQRLDSMQQAMLVLPAAAERGGRMQRDVLRLSQLYAALEAQLVEARLAAIGEGGDVRPIDVAVPQRKPAFPKPFLTLGLGTAGGLLAGLVAALLVGWFGRWLKDPHDIERALGVSAQRFEPDVPLLMATNGDARTVLVVPLDASANGALVAERLARTAKQRALTATVLDLTAAGNRNGNGAADGAGVNEVIERLERDNAMVVVQLPSLFSDAAVAALHDRRPVLFVAPPGPVDRVRLASAVDTLRRMQVPCAGVVISEPTGPRALL